MNKRIIIVIVVVVVIVGVAGAFLAIPQGPPAPQAKSIQLEAREFGFEGLGYKLSDNQYKGGPSITVKAGETVRIVMKNSGGSNHEFMIVSELPKQAKQHPEASIQGAMTDEVKPGGTQTIAFVAGKVGKYYYACLLDIATAPDRHSDRGMFGEFNVQG